MKPEWNNLLRSCCPKCGSDLLERKLGFACSTPPCAFFIRTVRYHELRDTLRRRQFLSKFSNARRHYKQAALNAA